MQVAHVAIESRNSEETGVMINKSFETPAVEAFFAHQIDQDTRIEIAATRSHDHAPGRGQTHAGIYGLAVLDGGNAGAVAKMRNDEPVRPVVPELA